MIKTEQESKHFYLKIRKKTKEYDACDEADTANLIVIKRIAT